MTEAFLTNFSTNRWYRMFVYLGAFWFTVVGAGLLPGLGAYTGAAIVASMGMFWIGMGEWINHPPQWEKARAGFFTPKYGNRKPCAWGWALNVLGGLLVAYAAYLAIQQSI